MEIRVEAWGVERERERRRWPGTKNKGCPPLSLAVARGAIRPAFQLTGRRCSRVRPRRKLALFTRRLRDAAMRGERKLATINSENQFERRWFFGGQKATGGAINGDNGCRLAVSRRQRERERERGRFAFFPSLFFLPSLRGGPFLPRPKNSYPTLFFIVRRKFTIDTGSRGSSAIIRSSRGARDCHRSFYRPAARKLQAFPPSPL